MRVCPKCGHRAADEVIFCPEDGARLVGEEDSHEGAPKPDGRLGTVLAGRYRIARRIGEGGMGVVYEAEHVELGKPVALKILREDFTHKQDLVERFKQEARSAASIGHENIIDVSDFGTTEDGGIFFAMELLRGEDLADLLQREVRLPLERAARIIAQMCRALHAAHQKGIIHRDLKPENVFLVRKEERRDVVKVLDFGIAKMTTLDAEGRRLTKTGVIFGTPEYMAPEQARGQTLDLRVDVYATGVMLYEMLAGKVPFTGESFMAILTQHLFSEVKPLSQVAPDVEVPAAVESVIYKAMSKDRDERYATMLEMLEDLQRALQGVPIEHRRSTLPPIAMRPSRGDAKRPERTSGTEGPVAAAGTRRRSRRMAPALLFVALLLAAAGAAAWYLWQAGYFGGRDATTPDGARVVLINPDTSDLPADGDRPEATPDGAADTAEAAADAGVVPDAGAEDDATDAAEAAAAEEAWAAGDAAEAEPPDEASAEPPDIPAADVAEATARVVRVQVTSEPSGAEIFSGRRRLCRTPTPCFFEAPVGTTLRIQAERGRCTQDEPYTVTAAARSVHLVLRCPPEERRDAGAPPADAAAAPRDTGVIGSRDAEPLKDMAGAVTPTP
ncbi:MAG: protein kinase [Deltaproteobacteria bacterium]|nr:protein kinase [Deltaproteobacteria bacterium]